MKDYLGNELMVDDMVVTTIDGYTYSLEKLYIIGFTEKKIKLSRHKGVIRGIPYYKFPKQVAKI